MTNSAITGAFVGALAANDLVVSKYAKRRPTAFGRVPAGFEPPTVTDMLRLLHPSRDEAGGDEQRVARISAAASLQALEARRKVGDDAYVVKPGGVSAQLLTEEEHLRLERNSEAALKEQKTPADKASEREQRSRLCRYCLLFQDLVHAEEDDIKIEVLNHSARIDSDFDPDTNIAEAGIQDFQLFLSQDLAFQALERSHPLLWKDSAKDLFDDTCAARRTSNQRPNVRWKPEDVDLQTWERTAFSKKSEYLYEKAKFPWNEYLTARLENVFEITDFGDILVPADALCTTIKGSVDREQGISNGIRSFLDRVERNSRALPKGFELMLADRATEARFSSGQARILSYGYSLEACIRSSYGLGWEDLGGLDIDDGEFTGSALHFKKLGAEQVEHLTKNDLIHLTHALRRRSRRQKQVDVMPTVQRVNTLIQGLPDGEDPLAKINPPARPTDRRRKQKLSTDATKNKLEAVLRIAGTLQELWGEDPWLVTISATKRLRYTIPRNAPTELWTLLSWAAPALLFTFMNRSVCQLPNFLATDARKKADEAKRETERGKQAQAEKKKPRAKK